MAGSISRPRWHSTSPRFSGAGVGQPEWKRGHTKYKVGGRWMTVELSGELRVARHHCDEHYTETPRIAAFASYGAVPSGPSKASAREPLPRRMTL